MSGYSIRPNKSLDDPIRFSSDINTQASAGAVNLEKIERIFRSTIWLRKKTNLSKIDMQEMNLLPFSRNRSRGR